MTRSIPVAQIAKPEPKRDRHSRYVIEGQPYTRATTVAGTLDDTYNLARWQQRMVAQGLSLRDDLLAQAQALDPDVDKRKYNRVCEEALKVAKANRGANLGDALHKFTEDIDAKRKTIEQVPSPHRDMVQNYLDLLRDNHVTVHPDHIEQIVVNRNHGIAGTLDRIVEIYDPDDVSPTPSRIKVVGDLKTGSTLDWSWLYISIQLAIYATHTHTYDQIEDTLGPKIDGISYRYALLIHLPSNGDEPTLHLVNLERGLDALLCALEARGLRKDAKKVAVPYGAPAVDLAVRRLEDNGMTDEGPKAERAWLMGRVAKFPPQAVVDLRNRWPESIPQPFPDQPTTQQVDQMHELLTRIEAMHELPFDPEGRPGLETQQKLAEWMTT